LYLGNNQIHNSHSIDILGVTFISKTNFNQYVDNRITKCRNSSFSLSDVGMCYLGVMSDTKSYLFRAICQPTILYSLDAVDLNNNMIKKLENEQGGIMKRVCGIPKRSHHTQLLQVLNRSSVNNMLIKSYMASGKTIPGTIQVIDS